MGEDKGTNVGKIIKGFCNGFFGRDDYEDKVIVYETEKAICCKYLDEEWRGCYLTVANFEDEREKNWCIHQWEQGKVCSKINDIGAISFYILIILKCFTK